MKNTIILAIDTSCDETSVAVVEGVKVSSNIIWSQASLHAKWGGVLPSLAKREHTRRIDWVIEKSVKQAFPKTKDYKLRIKRNVDAIAVTAGPCLAVAGEVGINKAKELSKAFNKPLITVNHIEGHLLSPLAHSKNNKSDNPKINIKLPALGIVTSGGHTEVVEINAIGEYKIIAYTIDDALGESLDKAARLLGFGYPGGAVLEKAARKGDPNSYELPIPLIGRENEMHFSYSGLKTAFYRLLENEKSKHDLTKSNIANLAASYQNVAFTHFIRVLNHILKSQKYKSVKQILAGGGVMANVLLRKMLRNLAKEYDLKVLFPYSEKLYTDNAAMIGVAAYFKYIRGLYLTPDNVDVVDRKPRAKVDKPFVWDK